MYLSGDFGVKWTTTCLVSDDFFGVTSTTGTNPRDFSPPVFSATLILGPRSWNDIRIDVGGSILLELSCGVI